MAMLTDDEFRALRNRRTIWREAMVQGIVAGMRIASLGLIAAALAHIIRSLS
jgi:hypothetical protein